MDCLLIGGAQSVGKSECIYRLTQRLIANGFTDVLKEVPATFIDFKAVLEGVDRNGKQVRILVNTPTDTPQIVEELKLYHDKHAGFDMLISSVRDEDFWPRKDFFRIMQLNAPTHTIVEIPLAKITRRGGNYGMALSWYQQRLDRIVDHILSSAPFNL